MAPVVAALLPMVEESAEAILRSRYPRWDEFRDDIRRTMGAQGTFAQLAQNRDLGDAMYFLARGRKENWAELDREEVRRRSLELGAVPGEVRGGPAATGGVALTPEEDAQRRAFGLSVEEYLRLASEPARARPRKETK